MSPPSCNSRSHNFGREHDLGVCSMFSRTSSAPASSKCAHTLEDIENSNRRPDLNVVTWNIAAPNNNPFEFWSSHESQEYDDLMSSLQNCLDDPGEMDIEVAVIFSQAMYEELKGELKQQGVRDLELLDSVWEKDLMSRKAVSEFLKDRSFGEKRLISMPDRVTNSVRSSCGREMFRPTPISGFEGDMCDIPTWWGLWKHFMFALPVRMRGEHLPNAFALLQTIPRSKYPALTPAEEAISRALQTLCLALFDAIFTHLLSRLAPATWQPLRRSLHAALFASKPTTSVALLHAHHAHADVIFIQEASDAFAARAGACLAHAVLRPAGADGRRRQMSLILARRARFDPATAVDVTADVLADPRLACGGVRPRGRTEAGFNGTHSPVAHLIKVFSSLPNSLSTFKGRQSHSRGASSPSGDAPVDPNRIVGTGTPLAVRPWPLRRTTLRVVPQAPTLGPAGEESSRNPEAASQPPPRLAPEPPQARAGFRPGPARPAHQATPGGGRAGSGAGLSPVRATERPRIGSDDPARPPE